MKPEHVLEVSEKDECQRMWPREVRGPVHQGSRGVDNSIAFTLTAITFSAY